MNNPAIGDEFYVYFLSQDKDNDNRHCYCKRQCEWHEAVITDISRLKVSYNIVETAESPGAKYSKRTTTIEAFIAGGIPNKTLYAASKHTAFYGLLKTMIEETKAAST